MTAPTTQATGGLLRGVRAGRGADPAPVPRRHGRDQLAPPWPRSMFGDAFRQTSFGATTGGNVLVVVSMRGGIDGLGMVVPHGDPALLRRPGPRIALPTASLVAQDAMFGLHPQMAPLEWLWDSGELAAVHAVGHAGPEPLALPAMEEVEDADPGSTRAPRLGQPDDRPGRRPHDPVRGGPPGQRHRADRRSSVRARRWPPRAWTSISLVGRRRETSGRQRRRTELGPRCGPAPATPAAGRATGPR